jgi:hypothetical protein
VHFWHHSTQGKRSQLNSGWNPVWGNNPVQAVVAEQHGKLLFSWSELIEGGNLAGTARLGSIK